MQRTAVTPSKFAAMAPNGEEAPYPYQDRWRLEKTTGPDRLVVAPRRHGHVNALLDMAKTLREPFGILYVLLLPRTDSHAPGRYQSPSPTDWADTEAFVTRFRDYFEGDGRHGLWLMSLPDSATLVYDQHDLIYAYGPLDQYRDVLSQRGFEEGAAAIPAPHQHRYNAEFDASEQELMAYWDWRHFPLKAGDDP